MNNTNPAANNVRNLGAFSELSRCISCTAPGFSTLIGIALFIIGCLGAHGTFSGATIGYTTVALAGAGFLLCGVGVVVALCQKPTQPADQTPKRWPQKILRLVTLVLTLLPIVCGILGITGTLS